MQHERGPRKPKIKESIDSSSSVAASEKSASSSASSSNLSPPIHQSHLHHSTGLPVSFNHSQLAAAAAFSRSPFSTPFSFASLDHQRASSSNGKVIPQHLSSSSSEPSSSTDSIYGVKDHCSLLECQAAAAAAAAAAMSTSIATGASASSSSTASSASASAAAAATAPLLPFDFNAAAQNNPGLLQMLLNAEKSQDLLWNLRYNSNAAAVAAQALINSHSAFAGASSAGATATFPRLIESTTSLPFHLPVSSGAVNGSTPHSLLASLPPVRDMLTGATGTSSGGPQDTSTISSLMRNENQSSSSRPNSAASAVTTNGSVTPTISSGLNVTLSGMSCGKFTSSTHNQPWDSSHEVTARLLFMVIRWIKSLPTFKTLSKKDQIILLEDAWKDLFLVNMAQWSVSLEASSLLMPGSPAYLTRAIANQKGNESSAMATDLAYIQEIMKRFRQLSPDGTECSCLKAVILFKPGETLHFSACGCV